MSESNKEIDQAWRETDVNSREDQHIQRLFTEPYEEQNPTTQQLFSEGAKIICCCGRRMETYREFQDHTEESREYYRNMRRRPLDVPELTQSVAMWNAAMVAIEELPDHKRIFERIWEILPAQMVITKEARLDKS